MTFDLRLRADGAADVLRRLPPEPKRTVRAALRRLIEDPYGQSGGLDVHALEVPAGTPATYRLRVGDWRAVFVLDGRTIRVLRIFHRDQGYTWLEE